MFPKNTWYVACTADEIDEKPLGRMVCNENIVFYRPGDGQVAAVEILNDHLFERRVGRVPLAGGRDGPDPGRIFSDHAAVCVSIVFGTPPGSRPDAPAAG